MVQFLLKEKEELRFAMEMFTAQYVTIIGTCLKQEWFADN